MVGARLRSVAVALSGPLAGHVPSLWAAHGGREYLVRVPLSGLSGPIVRSAQKAVQPGDKIDATLVVTDRESWLEDLTVKAHGLPTTKSGSGLQPMGQITHSLCTAVVAPDGRVAKVYRDNLWTVEEALAEIRRAAS